MLDIFVMKNAVVMVLSFLVISKWQSFCRPGSSNLTWEWSSAEFASNAGEECLVWYIDPYQKTQSSTESQMMEQDPELVDHATHRR